MQVTANKNAGSGKDGIGFTMQDHSVILSSGLFKGAYTYDSYYFAFVGWYNGKFASYDGNVENFFIHTWSNTQLQSIQFGASGGGNAQTKLAITGNVSAVFNRTDKQYHTSSAQMALDSAERGRAKMWGWKPSYSLSPGADDMDYDK